MFFLNPPNLFSYFFYKNKNVSLKVQMLLFFKSECGVGQSLCYMHYPSKAMLLTCNSIEFSHQ